MATWITTIATTTKVPPASCITWLPTFNRVNICTMCRVLKCMHVYTSFAYTNVYQCVCMCMCVSTSSVCCLLTGQILIPNSVIKTQQNVFPFTFSQKFNAFSGTISKHYETCNSANWNWHIRWFNIIINVHIKMSQRDHWDTPSHIAVTYRYP